MHRDTHAPGALPMSNSTATNDIEDLPDTKRRRFLARLGALTGGLALAGCGGTSESPSPSAVGSETLVQPDVPAEAPAPAPAPVPAPSEAPPPPAPTPVPPAQPPQGGVYTPPGSVGSIEDMIPPPGFTANISLNNLSALNPCPSGGCWFQSGPVNDSPWRNWTGAAFASGYSTKGAMVYWGGGHNGGNDISLYVFDFATASWSRIGPDNPDFDYVREANFASTLLDRDWLDYQHQGNYIVPALHSYTYPAYVPPGVSGAGPKGSWLLPLLVADKPYIAPHAVDLATGIWTRFSAAPGTSMSQGYTAGSVLDTRRNRLYWGQPQATTVHMLDLNQPHPRSIQAVKMPSGSFNPSGYYPILLYVPEFDQVIEFGSDYGTSTIKAVVYSTAGDAFRMLARLTLPAAGAPAMPGGFGVDWCAITRKFYFYGGYGSTRVFTLEAKGTDFTTCSWVWGEETFQSPAWYQSPYGSGGGEVPLTRWRYIPALKCFAWTDGPRVSAKCVDGVVHDGVMQLWRPNGT